MREAIESLEGKLSHTLHLAESEATELKKQLDELAEVGAGQAQHLPFLALFCVSQGGTHVSL
jgi:hypothetical protein